MNFKVGDICEVLDKHACGTFRRQEGAKYIEITHDDGTGVNPYSYKILNDKYEEINSCSFCLYDKHLEPHIKPSVCPFKKGDRVKQKGYTDIFTVLSVPGDEKYDSRNYADAARGFTYEDSSGCIIWSYFDEFTLVTPHEFKVGDRVRIIKNFSTIRSCDWSIGKIGVIEDNDFSDHDYPHYIVIENPTEGNVSIKCSSVELEYIGEAKPVEEVKKSMKYLVNENDGDNLFVCDSLEDAKDQVTECHDDNHTDYELIEVYELGRKLTLKQSAITLE